MMKRHATALPFAGTGRYALCLAGIAPIAFSFGPSFAPARAANGSLSANASTQYDDNIFRVQNSVRKQLPHNGADIITTIGASGNGSAEVGSVKLNAQADVLQTNYVHNNGLASLAYDLNFDSRYEAEHGDANVTFTQSRKASSFDETVVGSNNLQTLSSANIQVSRDIIGDIRGVAGVVLSRYRNSSSALAAADYDERDANAGIAYYSPAGNILALEGHFVSSRGLHDRSYVIGDTAIAYRTDYAEQSVDLRTQWQPSPIWKLEGMVGYGFHHDRSGLQGDQNGPIGKAKVTWSPRESLHVIVSGERSFRSASDLFANGVQYTQVGGAARADLTDHVNFNLGLNYAQTHYLYDVQAPNIFALTRTDRLTIASTKLGYKLGFGLDLSASYAHLVRDSTLTAFRFNDNVAQITLSKKILGGS
jgi:hypothetical protein